MADQKRVTFGDLLAEMSTLVDVATKLSGFQNDGSYVVVWRRAAGAFRVGDKEKAVELGLEAINTFRAILGGFLKYSVFSKKMENGEERPGRFVKFIAERENDDYQPAIIARLNEHRVTLEAAVKAERNGMFDVRIAAYTAMVEAIDAADAEQDELDEKWQAEQDELEAKQKRGGWNIQPNATAQVPASKRERKLLERRKVADKACNLFS